MFGVSASRVSIRPELPWYWRWLGIVVLGVVVVSVANAAYEYGKKFAGFDQGEADDKMAHLTEENARLQKENAEMQANLAKFDRQSQIDHASYDDMTAQVKALSNDNAALKEDLAFFETLMPAGGKEGITISRFKITNDALPGEYRYKLLLLQTGSRAKDFQGSLQFVVNLNQGGTTVVMTLPAQGAQDSKLFRLGFRFYQRVEGTFRVDPGVVVKNVQVRVFEDGSPSPKLTQIATVS
jgi:hypothetical protein